MSETTIKRVDDHTLCIDGIDCKVTLEALDVMALKIWYYSEPHKSDIYINNVYTLLSK